MKPKIFLLFLWLCAMQRLYAQSVSSTGGNAPCPSGIGCSIQNWTAVGQASYSISDLSTRGGDPSKPWAVALPALPSGSASGYSTFLSTFNSTSISSGAETTVSNLVIGRKYAFTYNLSTTKQGASGYATFGRIDISMNGWVVTSKQTDFPNSSFWNKWIPNTITFTATATSAKIRFEGAAGANGGYVNLDVGSNAFVDVCKVKVGTTQVKLVANTNKDLTCESDMVNLNTFLNGAPPAGATVVWYDNAPKRIGPKVQDPTAVGAGTYYAFYYDATQDCYNTDNSTAKVTVSYKQIELIGASPFVVQNKCPSNTVDLTAYIKSIPSVPGGRVHWFTDMYHTGAPIADPTKVSASGNYYAFLYDALNDCYAAKVSVAWAKVEITPYMGTAQVALSTTNLTNTCPSQVVDLYSAIVAPPPGIEVHFSKSSLNPQSGGGSIYSSPHSVGGGTYWAFYYDPVNHCYNTVTSTAKVTVTTNPCNVVCNAGDGQVQISGNALSNACPANTVNLNSLLIGNPPVGTQLQWFSNPTHTGNPIANPQTVSAGNYYAFYYDLAGGCFNTDNSTSQVAVTITSCQSETVTVFVKVYLQGAMHSSKDSMRTDLQAYNGTGLLPTDDPYAGGVSFQNINDAATQDPALSVVDWIRVEIREASNPSNILESKSLILNKNGQILNTNSTVPSFKAQQVPVRIVVKHRNHLPVMSNTINTFSGSLITYKFSTDLSQAFNDGSAPDQMKLVNGVWCMIAGDIQQDLAVDNSDLSIFNPSFNNGDFDIYTAQDLNLDGVVDNVDINYLNNSFNAGNFSILLNY